jgi:prepilin-type N-terminal cleavage/methylation domain-containing protein/prepilin-type processing-associated H-X9-DG protein
MNQTTKLQSAFTLPELLVTIGILAVLVVMSSAAYHSVMSKTASAVETTAAKSLVAAYQAAAADQGGRFLPAVDSGATNVLNSQGKSISMKQARARYPFRLAPYFGYDLDNTLLVGRNKSQIAKEMGNLVQPGSPMYDYAVSAFPALGINRHFVGGTAGAADPNAECVRTSAQADQSIIVFASAGSSSIDGYEYVRAPGVPGAGWSGAPWKDGADPGDYGYLHPRHGGKAVAAFLDGSVRMLTLDELRDMRLWSRNAALRNDPDYKAAN